MQLCLHWTNGFHYSQRNVLSFRLLRIHVHLCVLAFFWVFFQIISFFSFSLNTLRFCSGTHLVTTVCVCVWHCAIHTAAAISSFFVQSMPFSLCFLRCTQFFSPLLRMIQMISILDHALHQQHHMEDTSAWIHSSDTHIQWIASVYVLLRRNQLFKLLRQSCEKLAPSFSRKYNQTDCGKCISFHLRLKCWIFSHLKMA